MIQQILRQYWGYDAFRPLQEDIIQSVLSGHDTLALLPTGGGKSLCYQVPAMEINGLCLVISPLIALMKDQVESLRKKGITAFAIYSGMKRKDVINTLQVACDSNCRFLYVSPERLETNLFKEYLPALDIQLVAVDEAHCVSQWGYDFRPPYLRIAALREELPGIPVLALTASATPEVQDDIIEKLQFKQHRVFRQSWARPNLSYSVFTPEAKITRLVEILNNVPGSSIVYCRSRQRAKEIALQLQSHSISADYYHAGLPSADRSSRQEAWIKNKIRVMVCTNAFGMGIDKPDVRTVVHMNMPDCLENYYQEAGRAGRDGKKSYAVLLCQPDEPDSLLEQLQQRFPPIDTVRHVYQAIANYLQLPVGSGEGNYIDFDLAGLVTNFQLSTTVVLNVLKVLEQEGYMSFNEQVFLPSRVQFVCNKETLYQFEQDNPELEPLLTTLLRSYEGIFDRFTTIYEKQLAGWLKKDAADIVKELQLLHRYLIIRYEPQKDSPQLYFVQPRMRAEAVHLDQLGYKKRKQQSEKRLQTFIEYSRSKTGCRSQFIAAYFGDNKLTPCGVCDNCLASAKKQSLSAEEFTLIRSRIEECLAPGPRNTKDLLLHIGLSEEKAWQVIEFMQAEKKLFITELGLIRLS